MIQTLVKESDYSGKFIAIESFKTHKIVGEGASPQEALEKASKKGFHDPVITFVPIKGMVQIY